MKFSEYSYGRPCSGFVPPWSLVVLHNSVAVLAATRATLKWCDDPVVKPLDITPKKEVRNELETSGKMSIGRQRRGLQKVWAIAP